MKKVLRIILLVLALAGIGFFLVYFYLPYGDSSVQAGQLNYVMHKGVIFKTYEGKLILTGIKTGTAGGVQSNEFEFSIKNKELFDRLMHATGQNVKIHYKEYFGVLPWRGYTKYIVDSIVSIDPTPVQNGTISPEVLNNN